MHNWGIELMISDLDKKDKIRWDITSMCQRNDIKFFIQGCSEDWLFIEIWSGDQYKIAIEDFILNTAINWNLELGNPYDN